MSRHYYVYYRIDARLADKAARTIDALQRDLRSRTGIAGRRLRRAEDPSTWMEIYEKVLEHAPFESALRELGAGEGAQRILAPGAARHVECFED